MELHARYSQNLLSVVLCDPVHGMKPVVIVSVSRRATFGWGQAKCKCYLMASQHERGQQAGDGSGLFNGQQMHCQSTKERDENETGNGTECTELHHSNPKPLSLHVSIEISS